MNKAAQGPGLLADDLFGFSGKALEDRVKRFASGVLSPAIWSGYEKAGRAMCIAASEASSNALDRANEYVRNGGELFVDSGAFIYRDKPDETPWASIIDIYRRIAANASAQVTFVLPDVVGSQDRTLEVLRDWGNAVLDAIGPDHVALLPVQRGDKLPSTFVKEATMCLKNPIGGLAIPSNAAAFPPELLSHLAHVPTSVPRRVHFLGISRRSKALQERLFRLEEVWPGAETSCDACEHRAQVGQGNPVTNARSEALSNMWEAALDEWDDTEVDVDQSLDLLRKAYPGLDDEAIENLYLSQIGSYVDLQQTYQNEIKILGPKATTESIYRFASGQL